MLVPVLPALAAFLTDGDGADLSVSGLAGLADEQSPPAADGDRGVDHDLRAACSIAELDELVCTVGSAATGGSIASFGG